MITETSPFITSFITNSVFVFRIGYILFSILYFLFSLVVIRQVSLMAETLITEAGGVLKFLSILHAVLALAVVVFFIIQA